jgi:hypothetical protein
MFIVVDAYSVPHDIFYIFCPLYAVLEILVWWVVRLLAASMLEILCFNPTLPFPEEKDPVGNMELCMVDITMRLI